jgi:GTPase involved in cell partitioning and DNA repair
LTNEIERYSVKFLDKPWIMALSKIDLLSPEVRKTLPASIDGHRCYPFSAVTGEGVQYLLDRVISIFNEAGHE